MFSFLLVAFFLCQLSTAEASFFNRPDYFENNAVCDEIDEIIELLHDSSLSDKDYELRLMFKDKKLVPTFKALKVTMENDFVSGTDVNDTNGLRVELGFNNPEFGKFFKKLGYDRSDFFFLCGQNIYNNSDKDNPSRIPDEIRQPTHLAWVHLPSATTISEN